MNPLDMIRAKVGNFYRGYTEGPTKGLSAPPGSLESFGNFLSNGTPAGEATGMIGQGLHALVPNLGHAAAAVPMMALGSKIKVSPNAYAIHPQDQAELVQMINAPKLSPQQQKDLQNMAQHYLGGDHPFKTTAALLKTFDKVLGVQNRQPDPAPFTRRGPFGF